MIIPIHGFGELRILGVGAAWAITVCGARTINITSRLSPIRCRCANMCFITIRIRMLRDSGKVIPGWTPSSPAP